MESILWTPYDWFEQSFRFYMAAMVSISSRHGLRIKVCCKNQPNKSKLCSTVYAITFTLRVTLNNCT